jgi:hypothetical protein
MREALLLRSFLEYLRTWDDPTEKKMQRVLVWRKEIGLQLGNPSLQDKATQLFQTLRVLPPKLRSALVEKELAKADSLYFLGEDRNESL